MDKKVLALVLGFTVVIIGIGIYFITKTGAPKYTGLDDFAKCLTSKNAVMYGAYWCPHCQAMKAAFGSSFQYVNYVECTVDVKKCTDNNVNGYPTWIFNNGQRTEGEQTLQKLSELSGCSLQVSK
jgi:thiol-disulfide isomerase/thioredoxin